MFAGNCFQLFVQKRCFSPLNAQSAERLPPALLAIAFPLKMTFRNVRPEDCPVVSMAMGVKKKTNALGWRSWHVYSFILFSYGFKWIIYNNFWLTIQYSSIGTWKICLSYQGNLYIRIRYDRVPLHFIKFMNGFWSFAHRIILSTIMVHRYEQIILEVC